MRKILIQFDTDPQPSVFDRVVAIDAGVDELFSYGGITPQNVVPLVHGAIFTRKISDLKSTAIFVGGSDVAAGELVFRAVKKAFVGPMTVSAMMDSNGSNTTASACILAAIKHIPPSEIRALVLAGTGPVGCRVAQILTHLGAKVRVASRQLSRAAEVCQRIAASTPDASIEPCELATEASFATAAEGINVVISCGAGGVSLLSNAQRSKMNSLKVAIDVNAIPPLGIEGIEVFDKGVDREGVFCYGAIGVGGTKMKIHLAAVQQLFTANHLTLETQEIFQLGRQLLSF